MKILNEWYTATSVNGGQIDVKLVALKRKQSTLEGFIWVDVGTMIQLPTGEEIPFNLDGNSFYSGVNQLYRLNS